MKTQPSLVRTTEDGGLAFNEELFLYAYQRDLKNVLCLQH